MPDPLQIVIADIVARLEAGERNIKAPSNWRKYKRGRGDVQFGSQK